MRAKTVLGSRRMIRTALTSAIAALLASTAWHSASASVASAARNSDVDEVRKLIAAGSDVNTPEPDGTSALLWAAHQGSPELIGLLVKAGADPNAANNFGVTPLLEASRYGDAATIKALLDGGADLAKATREGETALMAAARAGSAAAVELLLAAGADIDAVEDLQEQSALMWAASEGHLDVVDLLLDKGANPNLQARSSELTTRSTRADYPSGGFTALHWAVRNGDEPVVRRLVEGGADLDLTNADGATPMMLAIVNDRFDLAATLIELGANADDGSLYYAMEMRDATTDWRARDGSRLRVDHSNKLTALDLAKRLLEAGADPDKPVAVQMHNASMCCDPKANATPFYRAAVAADVEAIKAMLPYNPDFAWVPSSIKTGPRQPGDTGGKTALMVAMNGGKGVGMAGGPGDIREGIAPPFREVSNRNPADAVKVLLEAGADPDAKTPDGDSALHLAAFAGKMDIVRVLVEGGANANLKDAAGKTALQVVSEQAPRPPRPTAGAQVDGEMPAQPAEVAELLRGLASGNAQASNVAGSR
jgi:ankyrin repeat protein